MFMQNKYVFVLMFEGYETVSNDRSHKSNKLLFLTK